MKLIRYDNPVDTSTSTALATATSNGDTTLTVDSITGFSANDLIRLENIGNEKFEVRQISGSPSGTTITLSSAVTYAHPIDVTVTKISYDKYRIDRDDGVGGYTTIESSVSIDFANEWNDIIYTDEDGFDTNTHRIYYRNSVTDTDDLQSTTTAAASYWGYIDYDNFIGETEITIVSSGSVGVERNDVERAIRIAAETIKKTIYTRKIYRTNVEDNIYSFAKDGLEFADGDLDNLAINAYDIIAYEEDSTRDGLITYKGHKIAGVFPKRAVIEFTETMPSDTSSVTLVIEVFMTYREKEEMKWHLKEINKLLAVNELFRNVPFNRLQHGISSWDAPGGISATFDRDSIKQTIEDNEKAANAIFKEIARMRAKTTRFQSPPNTNLTVFSKSLRWR